MAFEPVPCLGETGMRAGGLDAARPGRWQAPRPMTRATRTAMTPRALLAAAPLCLGLSAGGCSGRPVTAPAIMLRRLILIRAVPLPLGSANKELEAAVLDGLPILNRYP